MLTSFSLSCKTTQEEKTEQTVLDLPLSLRLKKVIWTPSENGVSLSVDEYKNLVHNILEYRRYISELEAQLEYYRGEYYDK